VRSQPAGHDLVDRRAPQRAPRQPEPQGYQPPRQPEPRETYRPEPAPARQALVDPIRPANVEQPAPVAAPAPARAPAPAPQAAEAEGGVWLRDVLRNASAQQACNAPQGLSGLSEE